MQFAKLLSFAAVILAASPSAAEELRAGRQAVAHQRSDDDRGIVGRRHRHLGADRRQRDHATVWRLGACHHHRARRYSLLSPGAAIGMFDRVELSYARQNFDTREVGAALGIGAGFMRCPRMCSPQRCGCSAMRSTTARVPQVAAGRSTSARDAAVVRRSARKRPTAPISRGGDQGVRSHQHPDGRDAAADQGQPERPARLRRRQEDGYPRSSRDRGLCCRAASSVGGEYRTKPTTWPSRGRTTSSTSSPPMRSPSNVTATAAYVDLGSIATVPKQRGAFLSLQATF